MTAVNFNDGNLLKIYAPLQSNRDMRRYVLRGESIPMSEIARQINDFLLENPHIVSLFPGGLERALQNGSRVKKYLICHHNIVCLSQQEEAHSVVPMGFVSAFTGSLSQTPVRCSEGHIFEQELYQEWNRVDHSGNCPMGPHALGDGQIDLLCSSGIARITSSYQEALQKELRHRKKQIKNDALLEAYEPYPNEAPIEGISPERDMKIMHRYRLREGTTAEIASMHIDQFLNDNLWVKGVFPGGINEALRNGSNVTKYLIYHHNFVCLTNEEEASATIPSEYIDRFTGSLGKECLITCSEGHHVEKCLCEEWSRINRFDACPFGGNFLRDPQNRLQINQDHLLRLNECRNLFMREIT